jgi:hypothetical protein
MLPFSSLLASHPYQPRWLDPNLPAQTLCQPLAQEALLQAPESSIRLNFDILDRIQTKPVYFFLIGEARFSLKHPKASLPTD